MGQRTAFLGAIAKEGGASCSSVTLSKTSSYNASKYNRQDISKNIKSDFNKPDFLTIHWDGKIIERDGERLAVLVAGAPNYVEEKLLAIPKIMNGTGLVQAETSFDLIKDWELNKSIIGMVFDATASNSGWKNGASVILEKKLNSKLFYLPYRHHIFEIILSSVWKHLFGPTTGPTNIEFLKLKNSWDTIPQKNDNFKLLDVNERLLESTKEDMINFLKLSLQEHTFKRDNYRECIYVMLFLLGEKNVKKGEQWLKPGAFHHARWMANNLYAAKMYAFSEYLGYDKNMI